MNTNSKTHKLMSVGQERGHQKSRCEDMAQRDPVAFSYKRFSSKRQERGDSVRRQTALSNSWSEKTGIPIDTNLRMSDLGVSAFNGKNLKFGALGAFLEAAKKGEVVRPGDYLVIEKLDRLSRDKAHLAIGVVTELVEDYGIRIVNLKLGVGEPQLIDRKTLTDNPHLVGELVGEFIRGHEESLTKSKRTKDALVQRLKDARANGTPMRGRTPGWIDRVDGVHVLIPDRAAILRRMIQMALDGHGPVFIAKRFNAEGVPPISDRSTTTMWNYSVIKFLLRSRLLIGEFQPQTGKNGRRENDGERN